MTKEPKTVLNLNSVLLMIVTALSAWTLRTVFDIAVNVSAISVRVDNLERRDTSMDGRLTTAEHDLSRVTQSVLH